jgi:hypothetical protein
MMTVTAGLLAVLTAFGGQAGQPGAMPAPHASTSASSQAARVLSSRLAYPWHWPNDVARPGRVIHAPAAPPVPELVRISVGAHPADRGERPFDRMSFTFVSAFPSYRFEFVRQLVSDPGGKVIPLHTRGVLQVVFTGAQAHTADGKRSSIVSQPAARIGYERMTDYAQAGDFEGVLSYGIGVNWPAGHSNPRIAVRAYEVQTVTNGQHRYTVAIDIDATNHG